MAKNGLINMMVAGLLIAGVACSDAVTSDFKTYSQGNLTECVRIMRGALSQYSRTTTLDGGSSHNLITDKVLPLVEKATYTLTSTKAQTSDVEKINDKGAAKLEKLSAVLRNYKQALKKGHTEKTIKAKGEVKAALEDFENWLNDVGDELRSRGLSADLSID